MTKNEIPVDKTKACKFIWIYCTHLFHALLLARALYDWGCKNVEFFITIIYSMTWFEIAFAVPFYMWIFFHHSLALRAVACSVKNAAKHEFLKMVGVRLLASSLLCILFLFVHLSSFSVSPIIFALALWCVSLLLRLRLPSSILWMEEWRCCNSCQHESNGFVYHHMKIFNF